MSLSRSINSSSSSTKTSSTITTSSASISPNDPNITTIATTTTIPKSPSSSSFHHHQHCHHCHHKIPLDCLHIILSYHVFHLKDGSLEANRCRPVSDSSPMDLQPIYWRFFNSREDEADWNFLRKYALCCHFHGDNALELVSQCRCMHQKPSFHYLKLSLNDEDTSTSTTQEKMVQNLQYLRGVTELDILEAPMKQMHHSNIIPNLITNLRGIQKLSLDFSKNSISESDLINLRGIRELIIKNCNMSLLPPKAFENLRGIQSLHLHSCELNSDTNTYLFRNLNGIKHFSCQFCHNLWFSVDDFRYLRGIKTLTLMTLGDIIIHFTDEHMSHLRGTIEKLKINFKLTVETNAGFKYLRGIQELWLGDAHTLHQNFITNKVFANLRGVKRLYLFRLAGVTSDAFKHLKGIKYLHIDSCPNIEFSETLQYLKGVEHLCWTQDDYESRRRTWLFPGGGDCVKILDEQNLKHLDGVKELELGNVVTVCDSACRYLSRVQRLTLNARDENVCVPLSASAFSHLEKVEIIKLRGIPLNVDNFTQLFESHMPECIGMTLDFCTHNDETIPWVGGDEDLSIDALFNYGIHSHFEKCTNGSWKMYEHEHESVSNYYY